MGGCQSKNGSGAPTAPEAKDGETADRLWELVALVKEKAPLVQCLTNFVSMDIMANGLLAIGASPAMVHATGELEAAVPIVGAVGGCVSINIGTLDERWIESFKATVALCAANNVPWVLDPVAAGFTPLRTTTAVELMTIAPPAVLRGDGSEILALAGASDCAGKGVDSTAGSDAALDAAKSLAAKFSCVVCVSGAVDYCVDPAGTVATCPHGHEMLTKVTACGCLVTSVIGAFVAAKPPSMAVRDAAVFAFTFYGLCAELAMRTSGGPGGFRVALMDALYNTTRETCDIPIASVV
jgi:hydroxyethylthiazole kinase